MDVQDAGAFESAGDRGGGGFQRLLARADPDGVDGVSGDAAGQATDDGFNFGEFGHGVRISRAEWPEVD